MTITFSMPSITLQKPMQVRQRPVTKPEIRFSGYGDTFNKRRERDELMFSNDLRTVLDFYESLPFKTIFQSKEDRNRLEQLMIQKEHAEHSRKTLEQASAGGSFMGRLFQERWDETGLSEEDQKAIWQNSLDEEGLSVHPMATPEDMAQLLGQYYSHEADASKGNNHGVGALSDQAKEDAQEILHSGIGVMAKAIQFIKDDPDMARIVQRRHLLTNPTPEDFQGALNDWAALFQAEGTIASSGGNSVQFAGRTKQYGKNRHNKRHTQGVMALSILGGGVLSAVPAFGYQLTKWMNKDYTLKHLMSAYKLDLPNPSLEKDVKYTEKFVQTTQRIDKVANTGITAVATVGTAGLALPLTMALGALSGVVSESYAMYYTNQQLSQHSRNLYDAVEDFPNVKIRNKVQPSGEVYSTLKRLDEKNKLDGKKNNTSLAEQYERFRSQSYPAKDLEAFYQSSLSKEGKKPTIFSQKNEIDDKLESTDLFRHVVHVSKLLNPNFKLDFPLKFFIENKYVLKLMNIFNSDDGDDEEV